MLASWAACSATAASSSSNGTAALINSTSAASRPDSGLPVSACSLALVSPSRHSHMPDR